MCDAKVTLSETLVWWMWWLCGCEVVVVVVAVVVVVVPTRSFTVWVSVQPPARLNLIMEATSLWT